MISEEGKKKKRKEKTTVSIYIRRQLERFYHRSEKYVLKIHFRRIVNATYKQHHCINVHCNYVWHVHFNMVVSNCSDTIEGTKIQGARIKIFENQNYIVSS